MSKSRPSQAGRGSLRRDSQLAAPVVAPAESTREVWPWIALLVLLLAVGAVRWHLRSVPLERDEGEFAYGGQLILAGEVPYASLYAMKLPGIYAVYALFEAIGGQTPAALRTGLIVVHLATLVLAMTLVARWFDARVGFWAAAAMAIFAMGEALQPPAAQAEHFVLFAAVAGCLLVDLGRARDRFVWFFAGGIALGTGIVIKQHGAVLAAAVGVWLLALLVRSSAADRRKATIRVAVYAVGCALPLVLTVSLIAAKGQFQLFWFWTVEYAREYSTASPIVSIRSELATALAYQWNSNRWLWVLAAIGLTTPLWDAGARRRAPLLGALMLTGIVAISPGFYFRSHYFIFMLPVLGVSVAMLFDSAARLSVARWSAVRLINRSNSRELRWTIGIAMPMVVLIGFGLTTMLPWMQLTPIEAARRLYGKNPFPEAIVVADYLRSRTKPNESIAVIGSEPEIFFYSQRRSATGHVYVYPLMEPQPFARTMQQQMIDQIEKASPRYLVLVANPMSWLRREDSDLAIVDWAIKYTSTQYDRVGVVDIPGDAPTVYRWGAAAMSYRPTSDSNLYVFRRKGNPGP